MRAEFRTYCGLAGDLQELLVAHSGSGIEVSEMIDRVGWFRHYKMRRAKKRLLKELELLTGKMHIEK